jgi:hypothetical protein
MTNQEKLFAQIRQVKLKPRMLDLLAQGITEATIRQCVKEHKEQASIAAPTHCPIRARKAITNAKYD